MARTSPIPLQRMDAPQRWRMRCNVVSKPMGEDITADLIDGLRRFKDGARQKAHVKALQEEKDKENQSNGNIDNNTQEEEQEQQCKRSIKRETDTSQRTGGATAPQQSGSENPVRQRRKLCETNN